ncbi:hypothetical protein O6H91_05G035000 [Diphasiastrum complanatum]|uniref:Uncharacterized protein n=1 Tax=Diphasiastrum complanatum TaxID=34168 RepID=A0ACC2DMG3_DIPCM|nr:hypothetical protein O6H91_05G035000 [Diphasiastrum complanatum]
MDITVALHLDHLTTAQLPMTIPSSDQSRAILAPNLPHNGTVRSTLKSFVRQHLFTPEDMQLLVAPLFTKLNEKETVEDIYSHYLCQAEVDASDLYVDEDSLIFFGRESGKTVDLIDSGKLDEYNILDRATLQLKRIPQPLPETGGRVFVETKDGIIPLLGVSPLQQVSDMKHSLEKLTGIPASQQLLSSIGHAMHDEFHVKDFEGLHTIYEDSTIDLCKSGDCNNDQAHKRMLVSVNVVGGLDFQLVVQGRDLVQAVMQVVESRTGIAPWQQRVTFSGKIMQEKKPLGEYFIYPGCVLQVTLFKSPLKTPKAEVPCPQSENRGPSGDASARKPAARKIKLFRITSGHITGTLTIPVLTTDTVSDLRRKIKRSLRPLAERNFTICSPIKEQNHIEITPKSSPSPLLQNSSSSPLSPIRSKGKNTQISSFSPNKSPLSQSHKSNLPSHLLTQGSTAESRMPPNFFMSDAPQSTPPKSCVRQLQSKFGACAGQPPNLAEDLPASPAGVSGRVHPSETKRHSIESQLRVMEIKIADSSTHCFPDSEGKTTANDLTDNKKGLSAWLSESMQSLKQMKVPFVEY